ncbi:hypothetical protein MMC28_009407 [Mycoblastus sanguinarius]|nr:hypothetical protein [Mycoblastus sanguinarius]
MVAQWSRHLKTPIEQLRLIINVVSDIPSTSAQAKQPKIEPEVSRSGTSTQEEQQTVILDVPRNDISADGEQDNLVSDTRISATPTREELVHKITDTLPDNNNLDR